MDQTGHKVHANRIVKFNNKITGTKRKCIALKEIEGTDFINPCKNRLIINNEYIITEHCFIINSSNQILLTQRSLNKNRGGKWE